MHKILVIDDEESVRRVLRLSLEPHDFEVEEALSGRTGIKKAAKTKPQVIILDLGLPDMNGLEALKELRQWTTVPVIVLTVSDDEASKVRLLEAGADDYVTKPFSVSELIARIRVALRHHAEGDSAPIFESGDIRIDIPKRVVTRDGNPVKFTATEFEFLRLLARNAGRVVSQELILTEIWGPHAKENTHYLRIYAAQLRKKLEKHPSMPEHILTEPGVGYRLI